MFPVFSHLDMPCPGESVKPYKAFQDSTSPGPNKEISLTDVGNWDPLAKWSVG